MSLNKFTKRLKNAIYFRILTSECLDIIPGKITGKTVLEVGCGRGVLAKILANQFQVKACDIVLQHNDETSNVEWRGEANIEKLPY